LKPVDEGEVVGRELVVPSCDAATLFDPVEELLDQVMRAIEVGTKTDWVFAIVFIAAMTSPASAPIIVKLRMRSTLAPMQQET
jgi:hypothetical protein